ncbi:PLC-like phosphodiesterase, partial [Clavulina sp. PMI_390]
DDSYPLSCYFVSTSHNTYLLSRQLFGVSSPKAYTHVISNGCRCIEIDVWDSDSFDSNGPPIVTHGLTLTESSPFEDVCVAIGEAITDDMWPLMVSLENHASPATQFKMVEIMKRVWGNRLVDQALEGFDTNVPPSALRGRILLIVEWYAPEGSQPLSSEDEEEEEVESTETSPHETSKLSGLMHHLGLNELKAKLHGGKDKPDRPKITPELAALGVYAQSVKPKKDWLSQPAPTDPLHLFLNISESAMSAILPHQILKFVGQGTSLHQVRIYPKGIRIESNNYNPVPYWRGGAQICAQNWQKFDKGMQLNRAMFAGSEGWILKPKRLLGKHVRDMDAGQEQKFEEEVDEAAILGQTATRPTMFRCKDIKVYVRAQLFHPDGDLDWKSPTVKATTWQLNASYALTDGTESGSTSEQSLMFLRFLVVHQVRFERDVKLGTYCLRLDSWKQGITSLLYFDLILMWCHFTKYLRFSLMTN